MLKYRGVRGGREESWRIIDASREVEPQPRTEGVTAGPCCVQRASIKLPIWRGKIIVTAG